jgi:hypothetical protein
MNQSLLDISATVTAVGTLLSATGTIALAFVAVWTLRKVSEQIKQMRDDHEVLLKQYKDDHQRSRVQKAVEHMFLWVQNYNHHVVAVHTLCNTIVLTDESTLIKICKKEKFELEEQYFDTVRDSLPYDMYQFLPTTPLNGKHQYSITISNYLRSVIVKELNIIETILSSAQNSVSDYEMIKEQYLDFIKNDTLLNKCYTYLGGAKTYAQLDKFINKEIDIKNSAIEKPPTG